MSLQIRSNGRWKPVDRARTNARGVYRLGERLKRTGTTEARVRVARSAGVLSGTRKVGKVNVYRTAHASWYGPGFYGNRMACGGIFTGATQGVAHKTLPCGTKVKFKYGNRTANVRVVDRGPYIAGREYDLTAATARSLGFSGTGAVLATR